MLSFPRSSYSLAVSICALAVLCGCTGWPTDSSDSAWPEQVLASTPTPPSLGSLESVAPTSTSSSTDDVPAPETSHAEQEPNDTWVAAEPIGFTGEISVVGTMSAGLNTLDIDVFSLGPVAQGLRISAWLETRTADDIQLGLFDEQGMILGYVDPGSPTAGPLLVEVDLPRGVERLYLMVATRTSSNLARAYTANVLASEPQEDSAGQAQTLVLVFGGADSVRIGYRSPVNVPAFDMAAISPRFSASTEAVIARIMEMVREDFAGLEVTIYRDSDAIPAGPRTSIYFGTYDAQLLGLADNIDPFNQDTEQSAMVYTDTFALFEVLQPDLEAWSQVLANVASHEAGHLLGLRHTADAESLMDVTASARAMMVDQWFKQSALHVTVLPAGLQDEAEMLSWCVGGALQPSASAKSQPRRRAADIAPESADFHIPRAWLGTCSCHPDGQP